MNLTHINAGEDLFTLKVSFEISCPNDICLLTFLLFSQNWLSNNQNCYVVLIERNG